MKRLLYLLPILLLALTPLSSCKKANVPAPVAPLQMWNRADTAILIKSGMRLKIVFDEVNSEFVGTLENQNATSVINARVEVHTFDPNGAQLFEYGPTTPVPMQPNEIIQLVMPAVAPGNFIKFSMHPEIG